jgi:hypothetical protein
MRWRNPYHDLREALVDFDTTLLLVTWLAIVLLALGLSGLLRQVHQISKTLRQGLPSTGPPIGLAAPRLTDDDLTGSWSEPSLLLFADKNCTACAQVLPVFAALAQDSQDGLRFVSVFAGSRPPMDLDGLVVLDHAAGAFQRFGVNITPFAVFVGREGRVRAAAPAGSPERLKQFVSGIEQAAREEVVAR